MNRVDVHVDCLFVETASISSHSYKSILGVNSMLPPLQIVTAKSSTNPACSSEWCFVLVVSEWCFVLVVDDMLSIAIAHGNFVLV